VYLQVAENASPSEVRARLADRLSPGLRVLTRDDPARGFDVNTVLLPLLGIFALIAVGVGVILIAQIRMTPTPTAMRAKIPSSGRSTVLTSNPRAGSSRVSTRRPGLSRSARRALTSDGLAFSATCR